MQKAEAQELINRGKALEHLKKAVQEGTEGNWFIVLGRFEAMGEIKDNDDGWTPLAIHKTAGYEHPTPEDSVTRSQGGMRIIDNFSAKDAGYGYQTPPGNGNLSGIWVWGAD